MDNVTGGMETSRQTYDDKLTAVESDLKKLGNPKHGGPSGGGDHQLHFVPETAVSWNDANSHSPRKTALCCFESSLMI